MIGMEMSAIKWADGTVTTNDPTQRDELTACGWTVVSEDRGAWTLRPNENGLGNVERDKSKMGKAGHTDRLHGAPATWALLAAMEEQESPNVWDRAVAAVDAGSDPEIDAAALGYLLALRWHALNTSEPRVAMRNVRAGDYVRLHGTKCYVAQVLDNARVRSQQRCITLKVEIGAPGGYEQTYAYDAHVEIPLIARPEA